MIYDMRFIPLRNLYYKYIKSNRYPLKLKNKMDEKIRSIKDIHKGETCFIIGNGPSMSVADLDKIDKLGVKTFATNSIYRVYRETKWRPTYYCAQDQQVIDKIAKDFDAVIKESKGFFIRRDVYNQLSVEVQNNEKSYFPRLVMHIRKDRFFDFSDDLAVCASDGCTITYMMIQIAYYMGFTTIYLVGVDHNFPFYFDDKGNIVEDETKKQDFFDKKEEKNRINPSRPYEMTMAYMSAKKFLEHTDATVYNATRGGNLEVFQRVDLDKILKDGGRA